MKPSSTAAAACALLIALAACTKKEAAPREGEMTVDVADPEVASVTVTKTYPGYLMANAKVDLVARVNGYLRAKTYESGQFVRKGQVLFRIEDTQYRDAVTQAQAQLNTACATNDYDTRNYAAMKKALESDAVSQMSVIQAESAMKNSEAAIRNAQAALETARTTLGYCVVTAPFDGHVTASGPDPGAYLSGAGSPVTLATIYDDAKMMATFNIDDIDFIHQLKNIKNTPDTAQGLDFSAMPLQFEAQLPHSYTGALGYIAPDVDPSTGTLIIRANVDNPYGELKDGMYTTIVMPYRRVDNAVLVKDASLSTDQAGKYLYTVTDSGRVVYTPVKVGEVVRDSMRIVTSGLKPGQRYVTRALLKVRDGMTVKTHLVK